MNRIKELRISKNMSQFELGKMLGLNQTAIGKYERGEIEPNLATLKNLSKIFECSIDYLLGNSDDFGNVALPSDFLSAREKELIKNFRSLSEPLKEIIEKTLTLFCHVGE